MQHNHRIDLRRLRRSCATYLRDEQAAQGQLRHSSVETTKRHYLKEIPAEQKARVERLDRELFGSPSVVEMRRRALDQKGGQAVIPGW